MTTPLIGITTSRTTNANQHPFLSLAEHYVQAVAQAGGLPVMLPLGLDGDQLQATVSRLDGIIFSGGGDIDPALYGCEIGPAVKMIDADRDKVEIQFFQYAHAAGLPFLGICRGLQVINIALGGTLYTHIPDQHPQAIEHTFYPDWPRDHLAHAVRIAPGSRLAEIANAPIIQTNSLHHQGIDTLADTLIPTAWAPDELIEGAELPDYSFGVAVQWHPEWLTAQPDAQQAARALFRAFVEAAAQ